MTPILFPANATTFETQGLGALVDAISCTVTEERNGAYELEMEYPMSGIHFAEITDRCIILAIPSPYRAAQPFRIYRITKPLNGVVTIYAQHISYDLSGIPLNPFTAGSAQAAMLGLQNNAAVQSGFQFFTDKATTANFAVSVPSATRAVLGGSEGSILDVYGGEYEFDGFAVHLWGKRGQDNGVVIRYGKNLTDIEQDRNIASVATGIYPYWADNDGALVVCDPPIINAEGNFGFTRVVPVDFSQDFEEKPTPAQLQQRAEQYVQDNDIGKPTVSITASFVQLEQTSEYRDLALLEKCDLCDTVTIQFEQLGIDAKAEITSIETDVLTGRYIEVGIGDVRTNIADTIVRQEQEIAEKPSGTAMQQAISNATDWIVGNNGGYVVIRLNAQKQPYEILIMDTPDIKTATNVWRWNQGGLGYSSSGYNGPYTTAITQDGAIVADFITVGTLTASLIKAGILASVNGATSINMETGDAVLTGSIESKADGGGRRTHLDVGGVWVEQSDGSRNGMYTSVDGDIVISIGRLFVTDDSDENVWGKTVATVQKGLIDLVNSQGARLAAMTCSETSGSIEVRNSAGESVSLGFATNGYQGIFMDGSAIVVKQNDGNTLAFLNGISSCGSINGKPIVPRTATVDNQTINYWGW